MSCSRTAKISGLDQNLYHLLALSLKRGPWEFYTEILTGFVMEKNRKDSGISDFRVVSDPASLEGTPCSLAEH